MDIGFIIFVTVVELFTMFIVPKLLFNILYELQKELQKEDTNETYGKNYDKRKKFSMKGFSIIFLI